MGGRRLNARISPKRRDIEMMGKKIKDLEDWIYYKFIFKVYKEGIVK